MLLKSIVIFKFMLTIWKISVKAVYLWFYRCEDKSFLGCTLYSYDNYIGLYPVRDYSVFSNKMPHLCGSWRFANA